VPAARDRRSSDAACKRASASSSVPKPGPFPHPGENLGWKGNVSRFRLSEDKRFAELVAELGSASVLERRAALSYLAQKFADSQSIPKALPPVGADVLTFARAKELIGRIIAEPSEGYIQQFMVAALLDVHRRRVGNEIRTHHPHAADTFDQTAGDIEEFGNGALIGACEVTVRADWKNRLPDFRKKMDTAGLAKYVIIASAVNSSPELADAAKLLAFLEPVGRDIAVVDIDDFVHVFCAELSATEIRDAVNLCHAHLQNPRLGARRSYQSAFSSIVEDWLDAATT